MVGVCSIDGCEKPTRTGKAVHCEMHYMRARRGSPKGMVPALTHCKRCNAEIKRRTGSEFCSKRCSYNFQRGSVPMPCAVCGAVFDRTDMTTYCSPECSTIGKAENDRWSSRKHQHVKRAKKAGSEWELFDVREVYERDGWICQICKEPVDRTLRHPNPLSVSLDHCTALSLGGAHSKANTQCTHLKCNLEKAKDDVRRIAKVNRITGKTSSQWNGDRKSRPIQSAGFRGWRKMNGTVVVK